MFPWRGAHGGRRDVAPAVISTLLMRATSSLEPGRPAECLGHGGAEMKVAAIVAAVLGLGVSMGWLASEQHYKNCVTSATARFPLGEAGLTAQDKSEIPSEFQPGGGGGVRGSMYAANSSLQAMSKSRSP
jgi:hypothetical protein